MEDIKLAERRWKDLELLQEHYAKFEDFAYDVITDLLGFNCTDMQLDIAKFIAYGPLYRMVQAQRGEAKTTLTACYAVWRLIHNPRTRVVVVSAGDRLATEIANWIIQIINYMPELACMKPDTSAGDRSSVKAFDVHYTLKGAEKSPSVACMGITASIQGIRADVLVADDIESTKNSKTAVQRELLTHLTKDFSSICSNGDIIYLGTPQNSDSVYNGLPSRGFTVRIWTGRYPTVEELPNYGEFLAPYICEQIEQDNTLQLGGGPTGIRGKATDPDLISEEKLTSKEIDQGKAYFQLQHMLDTKLMDEDRYPLKANDILFMDVPSERAPIELNWSKLLTNRIPCPAGFPVREVYHEVSSHGEEFGHFTGCHMYVDPAGGGKNGDETGYCVTKFLAGKVYIVAVGGVPGGFSRNKLDKLTAIAKKWKPQCISIEKNFGNGAFAQIWTPLLLAEHRCGIEEVWESGQKELRIIDILEPVISSNRLVVDKELILKDWDACQKYPVEKRATYSFFFQLAKITRDKGSLTHDDRLDSAAGSVRYWVNALSMDEKKIAARVREDNYNRQISNPLGNGRPVKGLGFNKKPNCTTKFQRRS